MSFKKLPPCPGDPRDFVLVRSKEGAHWRRKRGTVRAAPLNSGFRAAADATRVIAPATSQVLQALRPYLHGLAPGRLNIRIANAFRRSRKETKTLLLGYLKGIELQSDYPLEDMLLAPYTVTVTANELQVAITLGQGSVRRWNRLVTDYYFEAVLVYGDASVAHDLSTLVAESPLYPIDDTAASHCVLVHPLPPDADWCMLLKLSALEGHELAAHPKHYRMKVIEGKPLPVD